MNRRFPKLGRWLATLYFGWSLLVYFGTLGSNGHQWWPLLLYFIIWPLSAAFNVVSSLCLDWMIPDNAPTWMYWLIDGISAAFYVAIGTIWMWWLGHLFSKIVTRFFPVQRR